MKNKIKNISICSLILSMFLGVGQNIVYAKEIGNEDTINKDSEVVILEENKETEEINDETQLEEYESKEEKQKQEQDKEQEQKQEDPVLEKDQQVSLEEKANERGSETDNSKKLLKDSVFTSIEFVFTDDSDGNKVLKEINNVDGGKISVLEIPDTYEGKNVVGIKPSATINISEIETLIIPSIIINGGIFENKKIKDLTVYKSKHSLGKINDSAFKNNPLKNIDISGITYIGENAFWFSDADFASAEDNVIQSLIIDNSLKGFGTGNIFPRNIIKNLEIPAISIRANIFNNKGIENLKIRATMENNTKLEKESFANNPFKNIDISGITCIDNDAFWFKDADFTDAEDNVINSLIIDGSLKEFGTGNIFPKNIIKNLEIPAISIRQDIFDNKGIETLKINKSPYEEGEISDYAFKYNPFKTIDISGISKIGAMSFKFNKNQHNYIETVRIDESLVEINAIEPFGEQYIKHLTIPSVEISEGLFHHLEMETLNITKSPKVVGNIGSMAFEYNNLKSVKIAGIETIGEFAFTNNEIDTLDFSESIELRSINEGAFYENKSALNLVLPENIETIEKHAFNSSMVTGTLVIPSKLETIGEYAFSHNYLTEVDFSNADSLKIIGNEGFSENQIKGSYVFPPTLELIGEYAFYQNEIDGNVIFNGNIHTIGNQAFAENIIKEVDLKDAKKLELIEYGAFHLNEISGKIILPESIKVIESNAFYRNKINALDMSSSNNLEEIGVSSFRANKIESLKWPSKANETTGKKLILKRASLSDNLLRSVSVPESVVEIEENAFELNRLFQIQVQGHDTKVGPRAFAKQRSAWMNSIDIYSDNISVGATDAILAGSGTLKMYFDERALSNKNQDNVYLSNNPNGIAEEQHVEYVEIGKM